MIKSCKRKIVFAKFAGYCGVKLIRNSKSNDYQ